MNPGGHGPGVLRTGHVSLRPAAAAVVDATGLFIYFATAGAILAL